MAAWFTCAGNWAKRVFSTGTTWRPVLPAARPWTRPISRQCISMDKILIAGIDCVAAIGVTPEERTMKQRLSIDVEFATDILAPARTDSLKDALDYSRVAARVMEICRSRDFHLIETLAQLIADRLLDQ